jgi:hypothetical protein
MQPVGPDPVPQGPPWLTEQGYLSRDAYYAAYGWSRPVRAANMRDRAPVPILPQLTGMTAEGDRDYSVRSQTWYNRGTTHTVTLTVRNEQCCSCNDYVYRTQPRACKHIYLVCDAEGTPVANP